MKRKLIISNIDWDCLNEDDSSEDAVNLPTKVMIDNPSDELLEDVDGCAENIAEYLSDTYGYCVRGFTTEVKGGTEQ